MRKTHKRKTTKTTKSKSTNTKSIKSKSKAIMTIPELRRSFEHMETFALKHGHGKDAVRLFQEEWLRVFKKKLDTEGAQIYIDHVTKQQKQQKQQGGAQPLMGAPLDYDTRPGLYISPGVNQGSYAQVPAYVQSGFWNPEIAQTYDKVPGQTSFVTRTPLGMGDNTVIGLKGGGKGRRRRTQRQQLKQSGGTDPLTTIGTALGQLLFRPFGGSSPPSIGQDLQTALRGQPLGPSPLPDQTKHAYQMSPRLHTGTVQISPIQTRLQSDIRSN